MLKLILSMTSIEKKNSTTANLMWFSIWAKFDYTYFCIVYLFIRENIIELHLELFDIVSVLCKWFITWKWGFETPSLFFGPWVTCQRVYPKVVRKYLVCEKFCELISRYNPAKNPWMVTGILKWNFSLKNFVRIVVRASIF